MMVDRFHEAPRPPRPPSGDADALENMPLASVGARLPCLFASLILQVSFCFWLGSFTTLEILLGEGGTKVR
jgi:hypothetical protein